MVLFIFLTVNSQDLQFGIDDTDNDFSVDDVVNDLNFELSSNKTESLHEKEDNGMDIYQFFDLAKRLEAERLQKMSQTQGEISPLNSSDLSFKFLSSSNNRDKKMDCNVSVDLSLDKAYVNQWVEAQRQHGLDEAIAKRSNGKCANDHIQLAQKHRSNDRISTDENTMKSGHVRNVEKPQANRFIETLKQQAIDGDEHIEFDKYCEIDRIVSNKENEIHSYDRRQSKHIKRFTQKPLSNHAEDGDNIETRVEFDISRRIDGIVGNEENEVRSNDRRQSKDIKSTQKPLSNHAEDDENIETHIGFDKSCKTDRVVSNKENEIRSNDRRQSKNMKSVQKSLSNHADDDENIEYHDEYSDEEWKIERWIRLQEEERQGLKTSKKNHFNENGVDTGRLTAPPNEVRRRRRPASKKMEIDEMINELRFQQVELVKAQIKVQEELLKNAKIENAERNERLLLAKAERRCAELELECQRKRQKTD